MLRWPWNTFIGKKLILLLTDKIVARMHFGVVNGHTRKKPKTRLSFGKSGIQRKKLTGMGKYSNGQVNKSGQRYIFLICVSTNTCVILVGFKVQIFRKSFFHFQFSAEHFLPVDQGHHGSIPEHRKYILICRTISRLASPLARSLHIHGMRHRQGYTTRCFSSVHIRADHCPALPKMFQTSYPKL